MHIVNESDVLEFCNSNPSLEDLLALTVHELKLISQYLALGIPSSANRQELLNEVANKFNLLTDEGEGGETTGSNEPGMTQDNARMPTERQADVPSGLDFRLQLQYAQIMLEQEKTRLETARVQSELEHAKMDHDVQMRQLRQNDFDITKYVKLVPEFSENDVTKFFAMFENVATSLLWPKSKWTIMLQTVLKGKAQNSYASLSADQSSDYDTVKRVILNAYELVPEVYRLKFRTERKPSNQTYVEFAREKRELMNRWLDSSKVTTFPELKQLILLEEYRKSIPREISVYLLEKEVKDIDRAAILSDEYSLNHRVSSQKSITYCKGKGVSNESFNERVFPQDVSQPPYKSVKTCAESKSNFKLRTCYLCGKTGHFARDCWSKQRDAKQRGKPVALVSRDKSLERDLVKVTHRDQSQIKGKNDQGHNTGAQSVALLSTMSAEGVNASKGNNSNDDMGRDPFVGNYDAFLSKGLISNGEHREEVIMLRDSGALQSLLIKGIIPVESSDKTVLVNSLWGLDSVPLVTIHLESELFSGPALVGVVDQLPVPGVQLLLGNDLAGGKMGSLPVLSEVPVESEETGKLEEEVPDVFPVCAITRSMTARKEKSKYDKGVMKLPLCEEVEVELRDTFLANVDSGQESGGEEGLLMSSEKLIEQQKADPSLHKLYDVAEDRGTEFYIANGILMRRWKPNTCSEEDAEWRSVHQIVVPQKFRGNILDLAHDSSFAGHQGVRKTLDRVWRNFWWPGVRRDVSRYCRTCHTCQLVGKCNQPVKKAPLIPIPPFNEPFSRIVVDIVGPLPKTTSGNVYILTMMDMATRYPEAIPIRTANTKTVVRELVNFFTRFGLPNEIQSDQGSVFLSKSCKQTLKELGINQVISTAYHPQTQGALERYHQTMKNMLRKYCAENSRDWDKGLPFVLFATREVPNETLGFSPFELMFVHEVRGPLKILKESWLAREHSRGLLENVSELKTKMYKSWELARENLVNTQGKMKLWYDKKARVREFKPGDRVLVLLPLRGQPLEAKFQGPYIIEKKISDVNYVVSTPDRRKSKRLCHINMLKEYHERNENESNPPVPVCIIKLQTDVRDDWTEQDPSTESPEPWSCSEKSTVGLEERLKQKLSHLALPLQEDFTTLLLRYPDVFKNSPGYTNVTKHDVDVGGGRPIKQSPYRVSPQQAAMIRKELEYMLQHNLIEPCQSEWSSPVILVPKPGGSVRFCIDYRKVNEMTKTDAYPLPRVEDCIDQVGRARFITKVDLAKGYWQIGLTERAKEISSFVALGQTFRCNVMPFGMKNAPATFQRLMNQLTSDIPGCITYIDDIVIFSNEWEDHLQRMDTLLSRLSEAGLVLNLEKCDFVKAKVQYLGYVIGQGHIAPPSAKVSVIVKMDAPKNRSELRRFLGAIGYYRRFIVNFACIASSLTNLLKKDVKYLWSEECVTAFNQLKAILCNSPVLQAPNFYKDFKLLIDACDVGAGSVLVQEDDSGIDHPVSYFSKKFNIAQRNYSVIEKELLSLILSLQHFSVYLSSSRNILVYTDHHPLKFLNKFKNKNQRLTRWSLYLQEYNLDIHHISGQDNVLADWLSRL